jgi:4-diphosphocytidyl-2C-methyl-D-erythritol kinase
MKAKEPKAKEKTKTDRQQTDRQMNRTKVKPFEQNKNIELRTEKKKKTNVSSNVSSGSGSNIDSLVAHFDKTPRTSEHE